LSKQIKKIGEGIIPLSKRKWRYHMAEKLLKKYIHYFGDKPPFPPKHIMESLVRMKDDGTFDNKLKAVSKIGDKVRGEIEEISQEKMSINHPVFDKK